MDLKTVLSETLGLNVRQKGFPKTVLSIAFCSKEEVMSGEEKFENPVCLILVSE